MPISSVRPRQKPASCASTHKATGRFVSSHSDSASSRVIAARSCRTCDGGGNSALSSSSGPWLRRTLVHLLEGDSKSRYVSIGAPPAGGVNGRTVHVRLRARRRRTLSQNVNFLGSYIRQRLCFRAFVNASCVPLVAPILLPFGTEAALVARARQAMAGRAAFLPAVVAAVLLSAIVSSADVEAVRTPGAAQVVEGNARVHPRARADRNWTGASGSSRLRAYGPSAACTVRARVAARALTSLPPAAGVTPGPLAGRVSGRPVSAPRPRPRGLQTPRSWARSWTSPLTRSEPDPIAPLR